MNVHVALASAREHIYGDPDLAITAAALASTGVRTSCVAWDQDGIDWSRYDLVVIRSCWNYHKKHADFLSWVRRVSRVANPYPVVQWNIDKRYLQQLRWHGLNTIETVWNPESVSEIGDHREWVVKPAISAGAEDTYRVRLAADALALSQELRRGKNVPVMVQPYIAQIDSEGETSLVYIGGRRSHAVARASGLRAVGSGAARTKIIEAAPEIWEEGDKILQTAQLICSPARSLLYARIDLVCMPAGPPKVLEVELIEPALFLSLHAVAASALADAILRRVGEDPVS